MREAALFIASQSGSAEGGILQAVVRAFRQALKTWNSRREVATLTNFDDHMLADIGLTRRDVRKALELPFSHDLGRELEIRASHKRRLGWNA